MRTISSIVSILSLLILAGCNGNASLSSLLNKYGAGNPDPSIDASGSLFGSGSSQESGIEDVFNRIYGLWESDRTDVNESTLTMRVLVHADQTVMFTYRCEFYSPYETLYATLKVKAAVKEYQDQSGRLKGEGRIEILDQAEASVEGESDRRCEIKAEKGAIEIERNLFGGFDWVKKDGERINFKKMK